MNLFTKLVKTDHRHRRQLNYVCMVTATVLSMIYITVTVLLLIANITQGGFDVHLTYSAIAAVVFYGIGEVFYGLD